MGSFNSPEKKQKCPLVTVYEGHNLFTLKILASRHALKVDKESALKIHETMENILHNFLKYLPQSLLFYGCTYSVHSNV